MPHKLVRDLIPRLRGEEPEVAEGRELAELLLAKVREEVSEFEAEINTMHASSGLAGSATKLGDVEEALDALRDHLGLLSIDVRNFRERKRARKGGYTMGYVLEIPAAEEDRHGGT